MVNDNRTFCVALALPGHGAPVYLGKVECTEVEIRKTLPWAEIVGNSVTVFAPPPKESGGML